MAQALINGARLWYEIRGTGEPLLLHHGYTASRVNWLPAAERLQDQFQVILMECRGTGESEYTEGGYSLEQYAADVVGLLDHLGIQRVTFAGHSMGGGVGYLLGLHYPPQDIYSAYLGIVSMEKNRHASAIEFLDNVVGKNVKKYLFPIIDRISESIAIRRGQELFDFEIDSSDSALIRLIEGPDSWLKACALYCVKDTDSEDVRNSATKALKDSDPVVVETAKLVTARWA